MFSTNTYISYLNGIAKIIVHTRIELCSPSVYDGFIHPIVHSVLQQMGQNYRMSS